ncbi:MAG: aminoglycoside phosphotransferase family protein [Ruminococcaceae bacterium]|nr:aminoglycoside phosphotransferase family protein [Oscillospiraceae bacterium]
MITQYLPFLNSEAFLAPLGIPEGTTLDFSVLGQGEYNLNYVFTHPISSKKLVLRINTGSQMHLEDQISYEFSALEGLAVSGRTPKPIVCFPEQGMLVMEYLPGRALRYETDMSIAAQILADIHSTPIPASSRLVRPEAPALAIYQECLEMVQHYYDWEAADPQVISLLKTLVAEIGKLPLSEPSDAPACMVNTELNSGNFLINEGGQSYLVDWEKPLISEPAQDLGHFLAPTTTFWKTDVILTPEQVKQFAADYVAAVGDRMDCSTLPARLPLYFTVTCLRGVTWCAMAYREYCQPGRQLTNSDTFHKLKAYLEPAFLENILENYVRKDFLA